MKNKIPRLLNEKEKEIIIWLINNGKEGSQDYKYQVDELKVIFECACGCPTVDFSYNDKEIDSHKKMEIISDFQWRDEEGNLNGIYLFAKDNILAGLEVWSIDGEKTPLDLPDVNILISIR